MSIIIEGITDRNVARITSILKREGINYVYCISDYNSIDVLSEYPSVFMDSRYQSTDYISHNVVKAIGDRAIGGIMGHVESKVIGVYLYGDSVYVHMYTPAEHRDPIRTTEYTISVENGVYRVTVPKLHRRYVYNELKRLLM